MKQTALKLVFVAIAVLLIVSFAVDTADATSYTKTYNQTGVKKEPREGFVFWRFSHTFVAATDTVYMTLPPVRPKVGEDTTRYVVNVYTTSANGDSTDVGVRWRYSSDNLNWKLTTLGTDSTTWASTETGTAATLNSVRIIKSDHGGYQPYESLMLVGITGNLIGTKIVIDVIPQNPPQ